MNEKKYKRIFYFITLTIIVTIGVQFYWNYKNYQENKRQLVNEIQISFDNSIEEYYAALAKEEYLTIFSEGKAPDFKGLDSIISSAKKIKSITKNTNDNTSFSISEIKITSTDDESDFVDTDSLFINITKSLIENDYRLNKHKAPDKVIFKKAVEGKDDVRVFEGEKAFDSLKRIKELQPIFISFTSEIIAYSKVDSLLRLQFKQKGIALKYSILHQKNDTIFYDSNSKLNKNNVAKVYSKSTYVNENERLQLLFVDPNLEALKKGGFGITLSLVFALAVIACMFYLLKIIKHQKQLSEVKNDLISNITHEFKTPISTISVALESIKSFNEEEHNERTNRYLDMSTNQLSKLNVMVEKLLETATLDSDSLVLNKEEVNISELLKSIVEKFQVSNQSKELNFVNSSEEILVNIDMFHFENAINNIVDNAVKYGGNKIIVALIATPNNVLIHISDSGTSLEKQHKEKLFEQFYRVPKGNRHDVKGFGIGLYYTKKIIEKHNGTIQLELQKEDTIFKITLPNG